jgi:dihydropyrimidinase
LRPKEAEITAINKILNLSGKYKIKIHIVHVSTCEAAEILNNVKDKIATTCETAPHYLNLTDDYLKRDDGFKLICTPPLRNKLNVKDMKEKALDEYFDIYASDHCAFLKKDKNNSESKNDVRLVPCGVAGLGALPHLTFKLYEDNLDNALMQMGKRLSENPAKITGIYPRKGTIKIGSDADFSVLEIGKSEKNIQSSISDVYETYENFKTNLNFKYVFLNGVPVVKNDMLINADKMSGKCLIKNY